MIPEDVFEAALQIAAALQRAEVSYCLGGAIAYGQYGIPRATKDVDVNIFLDPPELDPALEALREIGVEIPNNAKEEAETEGLVVAHWGGYRIDLFTPSIPFSSEAERTKKHFKFGEQGAWFLSAEALSVFKLLFFRGKDLVDLERLYAVMGNDLDVAYIRSKMVDMMGEDDERVSAWDKIVNG